MKKYIVSLLVIIAIIGISSAKNVLQVISDGKIINSIPVADVDFTRVDKPDDNSGKYTVNFYNFGNPLYSYITDDIDYIDIVNLEEGPRNLSGFFSGSSIDLSWDAAAIGSTYEVYRSVDCCHYYPIATQLLSTSYSDYAPAPGVNYYRVRSLCDGVYSDLCRSVPVSSSGIFFGISGFNQKLYETPLSVLSPKSLDSYHDFVDRLSTEAGTVLYYAVDNALDVLEQADLPNYISTVSIVTFTDGLDQGSLAYTDQYSTPEAYRDAMSNRLRSIKVRNHGVTAYSIGLRGSDVYDVDMFRSNLKKLATSDENAFEVENIGMVKEKFNEIASKLSITNNMQDITLRIPHPGNGARIRFTFDISGATSDNAASNSHKYIEGTFNSSTCSLDDIKYMGLSSSSGISVSGIKDGIFIEFTFADVETEDKVLITTEITEQWTYIAATGKWQINSEFDKNGKFDVVAKSPVVILILDCSSSLKEQFNQIRTNAHSFIDILYKGSQQSMLANYTTPLNMSISVWMNGKRLFLPIDVYRESDLTGATVEGICLLSDEEAFILNPEINMAPVTYMDADMSYSSYLPDVKQCGVIHDYRGNIDVLLEELAGGCLPDDAWISELHYCYNFNSAALSRTETTGKCKIVQVVSASCPDVITWKPETLGVGKYFGSAGFGLPVKVSMWIEGKRYFTTPDIYASGAADGLFKSELEGIFIDSTFPFIINKTDVAGGNMRYSDASFRFGSFLPTVNHIVYIVTYLTEINQALKAVGGSSLSQGFWISEENYAACPYDDTFLYVDPAWADMLPVRQVAEFPAAGKVSWESQTGFDTNPSTGAIAIWSDRYQHRVFVNNINDDIMEKLKGHVEGVCVEIDGDYYVLSIPDDSSSLNSCEALYIFAPQLPDNNQAEGIMRNWSIISNSFKTINVADISESIFWCVNNSDKYRYIGFDGSKYHTTSDEDPRYSVMQISAMSDNTPVNWVRNNKSLTDIRTYGVTAIPPSGRICYTLYDTNIKSRVYVTEKHAEFIDNRDCYEKNNSSKFEGVSVIYPDAHDDSFVVRIVDSDWSWAGSKYNIFSASLAVEEYGSTLPSRTEILTMMANKESLDVFFNAADGDKLFSSYWTNIYGTTASGISGQVFYDSVAQELDSDKHYIIDNQYYHPNLYVSSGYTVISSYVRQVASVFTEGYIDWENMPEASAIKPISENATCAKAGINLDDVRRLTPESTVLRP